MNSELRALTEPGVQSGANEAFKPASLPMSILYSFHLKFALNYCNMTINHVFVWSSAAKFTALRSFYRTVLQPIGYSEMICANHEALIGFGSDYPYFWLQKLPEGKENLPTHIAFDAPSKDTPRSVLIYGETAKHSGSDPASVDRFYQIAL